MWVFWETVRGYSKDREWAKGAKMTGLGRSVDRLSAGLSPDAVQVLLYTSLYSSCTYVHTPHIRKTSPSQIEINSTICHYIALIINLG